MFGAISKFFRKAEPVPSGARSKPSGTKAAPAQRARPVSRAASQNETRPAAASPRPRPTVATAGSDQVMHISFAGIIKQVPQELWGKLAPAGVAGATFPVFMQQVLEQLPQGSVKIPFGELRSHAPAGVFTSNAAQDARLIDLPLQEILAQLHPDIIARRPNQVRIEVSEEVPDLFGNRGESISQVRVLDKKEANNPSMMSRQRAASPASAVEATIPTRAIQPSNPLQQPAPLQQPPPPAQAAPPRPSPAATSLPPQNRATPPAAPDRAVPRPAPAPLVNPLAGGHSLPVPAAGRPAANAPISVQRPASTPATSPVSRPLPKAAPAAPAPAPTVTGVFYIALDVVAANWPDGIRQELAQLKIPDAKVGLPPVDICEGLKRRRIQYPWRTIRSWIDPTPLYPAPSPYDDEVLELPLQKLTPLFLEYIRANPVNRRTAEADNITAFFRKAEEAAGTTPEAAEALLQSEAPAAPVPEVIAFNPAAYAFQPPAVPAAPAAPAPSPARAPAAKPAPAAAPSKDGCLALVIGQICNGWPEPVLQDINQFHLKQSSVLVPFDSIEAGLKTGRVEFTWRELCSWLNPPSQPAQLSLNGDNRVSLPLSVVAPQFMKARGNAGARRKVNVDEQIPDLFNAAGKPAQPVPAPVANGTSPAPPPVAAPQAAPLAAPAEKKNATSLNELFNEPDKRNWSPNDIVHKSATLPGVAGALIALQDGLLVAACMPPDAKTETIAAFVPQIFGRMNQYSKELQMGDCNSIALTVEEGTLHIFSAGIIYYAALSKPGELLPMLEIQLIASELSRHTK